MVDRVQLNTGLNNRRGNGRASRPKHQVGINFTGKHIHPLHHRKVEEINPVLVSDLVTAWQVVTFAGIYQNRVSPVSSKVWSLPMEDFKQRGPFYASAIMVYSAAREK